MSLVTSLLVLVGATVLLAVVSFVRGFLKAMRADPEPLTWAEIKLALRHLLSRGS